MHVTQINNYVISFKQYFTLLEGPEAVATIQGYPGGTQFNHWDGTKDTLYTIDANHSPAVDATELSVMNASGHQFTFKDTTPGGAPGEPLYDLNQQLAADPARIITTQMQQTTQDKAAADEKEKAKVIRYLQYRVHHMGTILESLS